MSFSPTSRPAVSAYIPCYNNAKTLQAAIDGMQCQAVKVDELFVVDDGSTDASREIAAAMQVRVIEMKINQGRGAVRARAMVEARNDLVLCCDATNRLREDFLEMALPKFDDMTVAGITGRLADTNVSGVLGRWRARHLFQQSIKAGPMHKNCLITWGTLLRKSAVMQVGNYDPRLRFGEDYELGERLAAAGFGIYMDASLIVATQIRNTLPQLMERFSRWYDDGSRPPNLRDFMGAQVMAFRVLLPKDLREGDPVAGLISLLTPYYRLYHVHHRRKRLLERAPGASAASAGNPAR